MEGGHSIRVHHEPGANLVCQVLDGCFIEVTL